MKVTLTESYFPESGTWVIRCDELPGLLIAHKDRDLVWSDVPESVEKLCELNGESIPEAQSRVGLGVLWA